MTELFLALSLVLQSAQTPIVFRSPSSDISGVVLDVTRSSPDPRDATNVSGLAVSLQGESVPFGQEFKHPLRERVVQVWLLRSDGGALPQKGKPFYGGVANMGDHTDGMFFTFPFAPVSDLAAVVVSVDGKIFTLPIQAK